MKAVTKSPTVQGGVCLREFTYCELRSYTARAAAKSVAGFSSLELTEAHNRARGFFVCDAKVHLNYGGLSGGAERLAGFFCDRSANPVQVTTSCLAAACGDGSKITEEAAIMATIPVQTHSKNIDPDRFYNVSRALRYLQKVGLEDKSNNELIQSACALLAMEKERLRLLEVKALHARLNAAAQEVAS